MTRSGLWQRTCDSIRLTEAFAVIPPILDGNATVKWYNNLIEVKKGDIIFVPAGIYMKLCGNANMMCSYI